MARAVQPDVNELVFASLLVVGTGMQMGRWVYETARAQNQRAKSAETRVDRRRWERAGPPRYDGIAWALLFTPAVAHLGNVAGWWSLS